MDRRTLKTKKAIRKAFIEIFINKNLNEITVSELAKKADIDRRTFYLHYSSVIDIPNEIMQESLDNIREELENRNGFFDLSLFLKLLILQNKDNYDFFKCVLMRPSSYILLEQSLKMMTTEFIKQFLFYKTNIEKDKIEFYANYVCFGLMGMYMKWFSIDDKMDIDQFIELTHEVISNSWNQIETVVKASSQ